MQHRGQRDVVWDEYWRLPGLLPVLSVTLARAVEPGDFERCAYCSRLARIQGQRPDRRRAWFGDHDYCRYRSRSEVMREVNKRYRARLAARGVQRPTRRLTLSGRTDNASLVQVERRYIRGKDEHMAQRRGHGEGSIYQRKSDSRYVAAVDYGYVNGKRKRETYSYKTRKEAVEKLKVMLRDQQQGLPPAPGRLTVAQFLDQWLQVKEPAVRDKTYRIYEQIVRLYLTPALGRHQLSKLTPLMVQTMLHDLSGRGLSPHTVRRAWDVLKNALGHAERWDYVSRNVALRVDPPRLGRPLERYLTAVEARTLLATVKEDRLEALYTVALGMGLRQGEALGLRWEDVNLDGERLRVEVALQRVKGTLTLVETKTERSRRSLPLPQVVVNALKEHQARQARERHEAGERWEESGLVFTTRMGRPLEARNVTRAFKGKLAKAGLPDMRWHDLRHSCASILLAEGVSLAAIQVILGHSQIAVTNQYAHLVPELQVVAARSMDAALTPVE